MDKAGPNGDLGVVRFGADVGLEKYVSIDRGEQRFGVPSIDEQRMGVDLESVVEVCHGQTSGSSTSTNKLKLVSDKFKHSNLEKSLTDAEKEWMKPVITVRKILQDEHVECSMKGSLHRVKMIQFAEAKIKGTCLTKETIGEIGVVHHSITLFRESLVRKAEVIGEWRLRDSEDSSSLVLFDPSKTPFKIMNI